MGAGTGTFALGIGPVGDGHESQCDPQCEVIPTCLSRVMVLLVWRLPSFAAASMTPGLEVWHVTGYCVIVVGVVGVMLCDCES